MEKDTGMSRLEEQRNAKPETAVKAHGSAARGVSRLEEIDREHEEMLERIDYNAPMTPLQTYVFSPLTALVFFVAAYFSYTMHASGDSGWGQTIFLLMMGFGFLGYAAFNAHLRRKHERKVRKMDEEKADQ